MQQGVLSASGIAPPDRQQVVNILNNILTQYYSTQPEYLLRRAKHYESTCFKRAATKQDYYTYVNEGVYKIVVTYLRQHAPAVRQSQPAAQTRPGPLRPAILPPTPVPLPQPADCIKSVKDFLISLGLTPVSDSPPPNLLPPPSTAPVPNNSSPSPQRLSVTFPQSTSLQHHSPSNIPVSSTATSTTTATNLPKTATKPAAQQNSPDQSQKMPKPTCAKSSAERSRVQRARKRNSAKAGLQTQAQKAPANRAIAPKTDAVFMPNASTPASSITQLPISSRAVQIQPNPLQNHVPVSARLNPSNAQPTHQQSTISKDVPPEDRIMLADGIYVSIAQVYITAASIGHRLTADNIRSMSSEQIVSLFLHARQLAIANAPNAVNPVQNANGQLNAVSQLDPLGLALQPSNLTGVAPVAHTGRLAPDASAQIAGQQVEQDPLHQANARVIPKHPNPSFSDTAQGNATANTNTSGQQIERQSALHYGIPQQEFPNLRVSNLPQNMGAQTSQVEDIQPICAGMQHLHSSAALQGHLGNRISDGQGALRIETISPVQLGATVQPPSRVAPQNGIEAQSTSYTPSSFQLVTFRLQRFQQKYRVYLRLVQQNLALLTKQGVRGVERERYYRYMRYVIKLLTCPMSIASRISLAIIDKVESFLREYLVRYQGIALKNRTNPANAVSGSGPGFDIAPNYTSNGPVPPPSGNLPAAIPQSSQLAFADFNLAQQTGTPVPEMNNLMQSNISAPNRTSPPQDANSGYQAATEATRNVTLRAIASQREAVAAAGIRQSRAGTNTRILTDRFPRENASVPAPNPNLPRNGQTAEGTDPVVSIAENRTPIEIHSQLAQRNMENESLLRIKEERIAEVCYAVASGNRKHVEETQSGIEPDQGPSLMEIVKKECEDARQKHAKLIIGIDEEWKRPVVSCLLAFQSIRMPKMIIHVPGTYRKERCVSFGFERPAFGWIGIVGDVKKKFYSIRQGEEGVSELLGAWMAAAEEFLKED